MPAIDRARREGARGERTHRGARASEDGTRKISFETRRRGLRETREGESPRRRAAATGFRWK
jgi:hypothetical protein